ncbi:MAG: hypothetical protein Q4F29_00560 [Lachnospiraceae bacterium]|nr:hypothetical protein [Lachnospiraceae bacterium]
MERYIGHIIRSTEKKVEHFLKTQVLDPERPDYGMMAGEMLETKPTIYVMALADAVYCHPGSRFYHDEALLQAMNRAMDFVGRNQRDNGGLDYPSCNFNSAADTSFCFKRLIAGYRVLEQYEHEDAAEGVQILKEKYRTIMKRALNMICTGGFHTPNHRWGITAALTQGANLFGEDREFAAKLQKRAGQYLAEGIDGNEEGEYAERSTGNYNAVVNNSMMALYEETGDDRYLGYIARNLNMMMRYFDPDDTIFTQNSTRQDQGKADYPDKYFYQYLYMASMTEEEGAPYAQFHEEFDKAAHKIIRDNMMRGDLAPECLHIIMAHEKMQNYCFKGYGFLDTYRKYFEEAGVLRVKNEKYGYSILKGKSAFLFMKVKETPIFLKIGESIGSNRNFLADSMTVEDGRCVLESVINASYYQPFAEPPATNDWWKMDHSKREILVNSQLHTTVTVEELEDGLEVSVKTEGLDRVPIRVQVCVPTGAVLENTHFRLTAAKGEAMILKDGFVTIHHNDQVIELGPGFGSHAFHGHYSGEEVNDAGYTIYMNEYTPVEKKFCLRVSR